MARSHLTDVVAGIDAKLKRRHPHVWGDLDVADSAEVVRNWEMLKKQEKAEEPKSLLGDIPLVMPALARSQSIQNKVGKVGFDWPEIAGVFSKINEEIGELRDARSNEDRQAELGDLLFSVVNLARWLSLDAESALRQANSRFSKRFQMVEQMAETRHFNLKDKSLAELEELWQEAKEKLAKVGSDAKV